MWRGKMATRWRWKDGHLKTGKGNFLSGNNPNEFILSTDVEMDTCSSVDQSILAIFEDTSVLCEDKAAVEEDSDKLLSALTEMLESVEDDDDTLSPFSTLPETSLLTSQDNTKEISLSEALGLKKMSKVDGTKGTGNNILRDNNLHELTQQNGAFFQPINNKVETEVEVFTSASLVNLVKIMHPYCLKLQVEEEPGKSAQNNVLFSKEEVWKYERPTEDIDEEINVVSDDEGPMEVTVLGKEQDNCGKPLKSALLLNGSPSKGHASKEKKRVSFGSVQVTSFDLETHTCGSTSSAVHHGTKALKHDPALQAQISSENSQMSDVRLLKTEGKRKSLSLQQYRQLRQKRQPLVEKQGNYTTKWPSVSELPQELTPILGVPGQKQTGFKPVTTQHSSSRSPVSKTSLNVQPTKTKTSSDLPYKAKRPRPNCKTICPASPLPNITVPVCKKSPTKNPTVLSSDPPNPVLVPLPVNQPSKNQPASEIKQNETMETCHSLQCAEEESITTHNTAPRCNNQSPSPAEENKLLPNTLDLTNQCSVVPVNCPSSMPCAYEPPTPVTTPVKEMTPEIAFRISTPSLQSHKGIEASDLTSLLEQFEETQAKEEGDSERALQVNTEHFSELDAATNSIQQTNQVSLPDPALLTPCTEALLSTSDSTLAPLDSGLNLKIPEPLGTEVILSTQEQPARRKAPSVKSVQIIDPRPLPSKRTHTNHPESTVIYASHVYLSISSDHDYCCVTDGNKTSKLNDNLETLDIKQASLSAPDSCTNQGSDVVIMDNSVKKNTSQDEKIKQPSDQSTLLTDGAKDQNSSSSDVRLDPGIPPTPPPSPPCRGRERRRFYRRSPRSDSSSSSSSCSSFSSYSSSSGSRSPKRQKRHHQRSESSSCSSSPSRSVSCSPRRQHEGCYSRFSRSRSRSWSRSRSRSQSPPPRVGRRRWRDICRSRELRKLRREQEIRAQKLRAIDERRVVYVGRIRRSMTHEELRERFSQFGEVECVSLHFRDRGDHYGFVTFYNMEDAFAAIDNAVKLRRPDELPFDICFGGRRQFCNSNYADLDANRDVDLSPVRSRFEEVDFDLLLKQAQKGLKR